MTGARFPPIRNQFATGLSFSFRGLIFKWTRLDSSRLQVYGNRDSSSHFPIITERKKIYYERILVYKRTIARKTSYHRKYEYNTT